MRLLVEHLVTFGFVYYLYATVEHALLSAGPWTFICTACLAVFLINHYGKDFVLGLGRIFSSWGHGLQRLGTSLMEIPDRIKALFSPPESDSRVDRLGWEVKFTRRLVVALCFVILVLASALGGIWFSDPPIREAKTERMTPPPAPQPFDKRWMAPGEREGIGGPPPAEGSMMQPPTVPPEVFDKLPPRRRSLA